MRHFLLVIFILSMGTMNFGKLKLKYQWKYLDLLWKNPQQKQEAIDSGTYNASIAFFYDVDKAPDGRIFITVVRDKGVPVSVLTITDKQGDGGPLLRPYPDWTWYKDDCEGITGGVYQVDIKCNHLFIVDGGKIGVDQLCLPQLLIFDLSTDKLVKRVIIPIEIASNKSGIGLLASCLVYAPNCINVKNNAIVFMGDTEGAGLVIYNAHTSNLCRVESDFMKGTNNNFMLEGRNHSLTDTLYGLSIIGKDLYYAALAGNKIYKIKYSRIIQCLKKDETNKQTQLVAVLKSQTTMFTSDRCAIFFNDITKTSIMCADTTKEINCKNKEIVAYDPIQLQFVSGLKIRNGELWVLSNRYHLHLDNLVYNNVSLNTNEVNFRVLSMPIKEIQKNTNCYSSCKNSCKVS